MADFIIIENARLKDIPDIGRIQKTSFRTTLAYKPWVLFVLWAIPGVHFLVARERPGGPAIGCMIADREQGHVRIMNIAVLPEYRRMGVGTLLMRAIGERMTRGNIVLMAEEPNHAAQLMYERLGFVESGYMRNYYGAGRHGVEMTLYRGKQSSRSARKRVVVP